MAGYYLIAFTNSFHVQCVRYLYDTAGVLNNKIRLRLHIGLKSNLGDLEQNVIRLLDEVTEVGDSKYL